MKILQVIFCGVVCCLVANFQANAAQLNIPAPTVTQPDFYDDPLDVVYNSSSQTFGVTNSNGDDYEWDYINGAGSSLMTSEETSYLTATINSGGTLTGGTFGLYGNIGSGNELLLSGTLVTGAAGTAWGYSSTSPDDEFRFLFKITGGASVVESDFGGVGATDGVDLFALFTSNSGHDTAFNGTWGSGSFNNLYNGGAGTGQGDDDIYEVPEPSSLTLVSVAAALSSLTLIYQRKPKVQPAPAQAEK